jgi:uncharacterized surface protein with fasciclin (FAS1) repeats
LFKANKFKFLRIIIMAAIKKLILAIALIILPLTANAGSYGAKKDIVDTAIANGSFTTLVTAVKAAGLVDTLKGKGPFTVFAPSDAAFSKLPKGTIDSLLKPENKSKLVAILTHHVIAGAVSSAGVVGKKLSSKTVNGSSLSIDGTKGVMVSGAKVITADVRASNGIIHVIDKVLLP